MILLKARFGSEIIPIKVGRNPITVGRSSRADVKIPDEEISSEHCSLKIEEGRLIIKDLGSTNGVHVNGYLTVESYISIGDEVQIGQTFMTLDERSLSPEERELHSQDIAAPSRNEIQLKAPAPEAPAFRPRKKRNDNDISIELGDQLQERRDRNLKYAKQVNRIRKNEKKESEQKKESLFNKLKKAIKK